MYMYIYTRVYTLYVYFVNTHVHVHEYSPPIRCYSAHIPLCSLIYHNSRYSSQYLHVPIHVKHVAYLGGMETMVFVCFVVSVVNVRLSVHWTTTRLAFAVYGYFFLLLVTLHCCRHIFPVTHHCSCYRGTNLQKFIC